MKKEKTEIKRKYIITSKELKEKLKLKGDVTGMGLWAGRSLAMEEAGEPAEFEEWEIITEEFEE